MDREEMTPLEMVAEFAEAFGASDDKALWLKLIEEEIGEAEEAAAHLLKELSDIGYVSAGLANLVSNEDEYRELVQPLLDRAVRLDKLVDAFDGVYHEAFRRVHESNMSKLGPDGKPVYREDGKIMKGPNYREPVLIDLIRGE